MGNRCQPSQTGSRNPPASVPKSAAALLLSQITTTKDSSPPFCPGFNSLPAHLSWAIKHTRDKPRNPPQRRVLFRRAGRGKAPSSPRAGGCPPACCLHQGGRQPRRNCCGFILPVQGDGELWEERRGEERSTPGPRGVADNRRKMAALHRCSPPWRRRAVRFLPRCSRSTRPGWLQGPVSAAQYRCQALLFCCSKV